MNNQRNGGGLKLSANGRESSEFEKRFTLKAERERKEIETVM